MAALFNGEGVYVAMLPAAKGGITADALYKTDRISGPAAGQAYPRCMSLALLTKRLPVNLPPSASGPPPLGVLLRKDLLSPYVQCLAVSLNPPVTQRTCPYFSAAKHKCQCQGGSDLDCARQSPAQQAGCGVIWLGAGLAAGAGLAWLPRDKAARAAAALATTLQGEHVRHPEQDCGAHATRRHALHQCNNRRFGRLQPHGRCLPPKLPDI